MLDMKLLRNNPDLAVNGMKKRGIHDNSVDEALDLDREKRLLLTEVEQMKNQRNRVSQEISNFKREGMDAEEKILEMRDVSRRIKELDDRIRELNDKINYLLLTIPNIPHESVPSGVSEDDNMVVSRWGNPTTFDFQHQAHWDMGEHLNLLDFERAGNVTGARFVFYRGAGARLERSLINFMLNLHIEEHGYQEIFPPFMVHRDSMVGTGQLPKFEEDAFKIEDTEYFLIPTAEVPVTNLYRGEILEADQLPMRYTAYSACFRAEAGAHGRDTRGLIRQHQFNKVELVKFVSPEDSYEELESLTADAERVLQLLELPYRKVNLCAGDLGFSSAKTYDLEVWMPSYDDYVEISSCSNFEDYQARRANIRYRPKKGGRPRYVHTLNGSGIAIGRAAAAILENYQQEDGSVVVPKVLKPYMGGLEKICFPH
ncbi:MAG: serine--tRNA ligase [Clostridia bacterium]|nr:serine--tRNA ligase [Clostridia bacterium]